MIYNNKENDTNWGKFRLPKVYRFTYATHKEGPFANADVKTEDIPDFFQDFKKKDVSCEYFDTTNVTVNLTNRILKEPHYAYLCVFGFQMWHPVQWGQIEERRTTFKGMGRDIVYLPAYYKNGMLEPAASPFWLSPDGKIEILKRNRDLETIMVRITSGECYYKPMTHYVKRMNGTTAWGIHNGQAEELLCKPFEQSSLGRNHISVQTENMYRFIRLKLPSDSLAWGDISFYSSHGRIKDVKVVSSLKSYSKEETLEMLTDGVDATTFLGKAAKSFVDIDLGQEYKLTEIVVSPYLPSQLYTSDFFELFYWENGWQTLMKKRGTLSYLTFEKVPKGALLMLKNCSRSRYSNERIFRYKDGEVIWH